MKGVKLPKPLFLRKFKTNYNTRPKNQFEVVFTFSQKTNPH
ncbi:hypothetical protein RCH33_1084 [Flavobacterium daejeonense]|nr:hypothetical protein RCH33_1084 [Flavobacterium daejeonense]